MQLAKPFYKLPVRFCAETLAAELKALPASAWTPHPTGYAGNEAVRLITPHGADTDGIEGPMAPTPHLLACPYVMEVMAALGGVWGRSRFMGLAAGAEVPAHIDVNYYWRTHLRIHIPVVTNPGVIFTCGPEAVHMEAGECWTFDSFLLHNVQNKGTEQRVHLVIDTVVTAALWELIGEAQTDDPKPRTIVPGESAGRALLFEQVNRPKVMSPWEIKIHMAFLADHMVPHPKLDEVLRRMEKFICSWQGAWAQFGTDDAGLPLYRQLVAEVRQDLQRIAGDGEIVLKNDQGLFYFLQQMIFIYAVVPPRPAGVVSSTMGGSRLAS